VSRTFLACAGVAALSLAAGSAVAKNTTGGGAMMSGSHSGMMMSSKSHKSMSKMDAMMVKNCKAMPHDKMMADAECQDYMKNHPDWMKASPGQ
jgi:hypothetical protein